MEQLQAGDMLELMTPTGRFGTPLHPLARKHYVAIAAGSGITPVLSILQTTLAIETESRFTLIYGNRDADSTMFRDELDELEARYADRLQIIHVRSRDPRHPGTSARAHRPREARAMARLRPRRGTVDEWFLCGPVELVTDLRDPLIEHGVEPDHIHLELFFGYQKPKVADGFTPRRSRSACAAASTRSRWQPGDTVLEAALKAGPDAPVRVHGRRVRHLQGEGGPGDGRDGSELRPRHGRRGRRLRAHLPVPPHQRRRSPSTTTPET